jgi:hypothetical protein
MARHIGKEEMVALKRYCPYMCRVGLRKTRINLRVIGDLAGI